MVRTVRPFTFASRIKADSNSLRAFASRLAFTGRKIDGSKRIGRWSSKSTSSVRIAGLGPEVLAIAGTYDRNMYSPIRVR